MELGAAAQPGRKYRQEFAASLEKAGIGMAIPPKHWLVHPVRSVAMPYGYGLRSMQSDFEVWFDVRQMPDIPNGDSLAIRQARKQVALLSSGQKIIAKTVPPEIMKEFFNADLGRSFAVTLRKRHSTRNYRYGLLMVVQKNGQSSLAMLFLSNENGPAFYRDVNRIFYSVKFK